MSKLLGLYIGLFKVLDVSTRTVHDWQRHNNLAKGIKDVFFKRLPEGQSGGYFPWFLQNQHLVDQSLPEPGNQGLADEMWLRAWRYIGGDVADTTSRIREIIHGWPDARQECFIFYSVILSESHPGPDMDGWILLGFCTSNQYAEPSEGRLCRLYRILATRVTFDEFYTAYNSSSLIGLIDRKDLREERLQFPYLEDVLAGSPEVFKSVWYLKKFTFTEDIYPERSVMVDYGFANCENPKERLELKQVYKQFFDEGGDAMELHRACLAGKLFEFLKAVRGVNQDFKRLLRNVYPLKDI